MKIIYALKSAGIDDVGSFENPKYFSKPTLNAEHVIIYGNYPEIQNAYAELGVNVEVRALAEPPTVQVGTTPELQAALDERDVLAAKVLELQAEIATLKSTPKKPTAAEIKAAKAAEIEAQKDQE